MEERTLNRVLYVLLAIVAYLFYGELRRAWEARQEAVWDDRYIDAVRSSPESWQFGWRLEDLEARLHVQRAWADELLATQAAQTSRRDAKDVSAPTSSDVSRSVDAAALRRVVSGDTESYVTIQCASRPHKLVHVGPDEFRDMSDRCRAFSSLDETLLGPHATWEVVPLEDDYVGLRAMSNGRFVKMKPPPADAAWNAPWLLETTSPLPGLAERFQFRRVDADLAGGIATDDPREAQFASREEAWGAEEPERPRDDPAYVDDGARGVIGGFGAARRLLQPGDLHELEGVQAFDELPRASELNVVGDAINEGSILEETVVPSDEVRASRSRVVMIYSENMRGYLQCGGDGVSEPIRGFAGESLLDETEDYHFNVTWLSSGVSRQRDLLAASDHVRQLTPAVPSATTADATKSPRNNNNNNKQPTKNKKKKLKIALVVPMTSRGTEMDSVDQSPLWFNLFSSFVESIDWRKNAHEFTFYLGFDRGDPLYDTGDAWTETRRAFRSHARKAMRWLGYGNWTVHKVLHGARAARSKKRRFASSSSLQDDSRQQPQQHVVVKPTLSLELVHFDDTLGAPSQAVSGLARRARDDGADYIYQLNDDTILVSKDWVDVMVDALRNSPLAPDLGVAGPLDTTNERILTHAFVSKTHVDIFDGMFPTAFRNWWSDDWISAVYGSRATFARRDVVVTHNVQSQKTNAWNRYDVDHRAQYLLHDQVQRGFVIINQWLRDRGHPTMPLPYICGYSPMMTRIYDTLMRHGL